MDYYDVDTLDLDLVANRLLRGEIMIYPTETVAGIGSIGSDPMSVGKIFAAKRRNHKKPVSYAFTNRSQVEIYVEIPPWADNIFSLLPGPLTVVLPRKAASPTLYGVTNTVGIRIPDQTWLLNLLEVVGKPVISTSANLAGQATSAYVDNIPSDLLDYVDFVIRWHGELTGDPSTVIKLDMEQENIQLLREGAIPFETISSLL